MKIKICGLKTYEEAALAVERGADLLGFNFYPPSPRYIHPDDCRRLVLRLQNTFKGNDREVLMVGVFVNVPTIEVQNILDECCLDLAQLSGDETPEMLEELDDRAYKSIRLASHATLLNDMRRYPKRQAAPSWLVDAYQPGAYGGTGQVADWSLARELAAHAPILLAGGLNPENIQTAIRQVHPWGVDVASGVESSPGCKDPIKIAAFIDAVRACEEEAYSC